jgi:hypothetical protein
MYMQNKKMSGKGLDSSCWRVFPLMLGWCLLFISSSAQSANPETLLSADEIERLKRGEILTETIHNEKSGGAARVMALFHAAPEDVWNTIGYCENEFVYVRGLELCEVLIPGLQLIRKHHRVNNNWYTPTIDFVFEAIRTSPTRGEFRLVEGNLRVLEGQWDFQPLAGGEAIVVTHDIRVRSRFPAPRWLVRRVLKGDLPDMLACVRGMSKGSGDDSLASGDLARCPGDPSRSRK